MITQEEKDTFLALLRSGKDPQEAARTVRPDYTGTMFRALTNESTANYDNAFAADYLRAKAEGRAKMASKGHSNGEPRPVTISGHVKAKYLTDEMLDAFLEHVSLGVPLIDAVALIEPKTSMTQITRRANSDQEFADAFAEARETGYPLFKEGLRSLIWRLAQSGDYRAARDLALIHLDEFKQLATQRHEISGPGGEAVRLLAERALPELPPEMLETLIKGMEERRTIEAA